MSSRKESLIAKYAPPYVTFDGSIDDDKTLGEIIHWVQGITFEPGELRQVIVKAAGQVYYIWPTDIHDSYSLTRDIIKSHQDRRVHLDRRRNPNRQHTGRRLEDHLGDNDAPADT